MSVLRTLIHSASIPVISSYALRGILFIRVPNRDNAQSRQIPQGSATSPYTLWQLAGVCFMPLG